MATIIVVVLESVTVEFVMPRVDKIESVEYKNN